MPLKMIRPASRWWNVGAVGLALWAAAGCSALGGDGSLQTLEVENAILSTQISDIRSTATYANDRLSMTAEFYGTAVEQVERRRAEVSVTLQAANVDGTAIAQVSPNPEFRVTLTAEAAGSMPVVASAAPGSNAAIVTATPTVGQSNLFNMVTAAEVGSNDCALAPVGTFTTSSPRIYAVATAANVSAGTVLGSQWMLNGTVLVIHDFTPDFNINENCIWFFVDQADFAFTPGNYSVQFTVNGAPAGAPVAFTISE